MMDSWYQPSRARYSPAVGGISVNQPCHPKPKIKSIPVHFVGSETARSESALRIQKLFRGFLVRKSIKRIMAIKSQVIEIERSVLEEENMELIRKDAKERLRINETLMALIFKLDSIRGISPGIRDCRKAVIKKAVSLQEKVDFIAASPLDQTTLVSQPGRRDEEAVDAVNSNLAAAESVNHVQEPDHRDEEVVDAENSNSAAAESVNQDHEPDHRDEEVVDAEKYNSAAAESVDEAQEMKETADDLIESVNFEVNADEEEPCVIKEVTESECCKKTGLIEERKRDDSSNNIKVLEKMVSENEKMMRMMSQLCERNELQTRMLTSLTQRVERLEKAFICCDKLRNKKKNKTKHAPHEKKLKN